MNRCQILLASSVAAVAILAMSFLVPVVPVPAHADGPGDWPMFRHDLAHSGNNPNETGLKPPLRLKWSYTTGDAVVSSPAVVDGVAYVGSKDNKLYALDAATGILQWSYTSGGPVYSSPALVDGVVYVGFTDTKWLALGATTGNLLWGWAGGNVYSSLAVASGVIYVGYGIPTKSVYAFDVLQRGPKWSYATGGEVLSSPAVANGVVYVGSTDNKLYALNANSSALSWSFPTGGEIHSSPALAEGVVYVGSKDNKLYALNAITGELLWSYVTGGEVLSSPAVANGVVYVGSTDNKLYALNAASGALSWSYATAGEILSSPAVANGVVYVGSKDNKLYALNATTGELLWSYMTGEIRSPAVVNGMLYGGSVDSKVYAFESQPPMLLIEPLAPYRSNSASFPITWTVPVTWTGIAATSYDVQYRDGASADWIDLITSTETLTATFPGVDGYTFYFRGRTRTATGSLGEWSEPVITTVDLTTPIGSIQAQGWTSPVNPVTLTLALSATDSTSGISHMAFSTDGATYSSWENYVTSRSFLAPAGASTVYARFKDQAGNISSPVSATLTVDSLPPTGTLSINGGARDTTGITVTLDLLATDSVSLVVDSAYSHDGSAWSNWESFTANKQWAVPEGDGPKSVWARFRDAVSNVSTPISRTIYLDTTVRGTTGVSINDGGLFANQVTVTLSLPPPYQVAEMLISNDGAFAGASWEPYAAYRPWAITQYGSYVIPRTVYVKYKDVNGVVSGTYQDDIILDINAPTGSISVEGATTADRTFAGTVSLRLSASDDVSGIGGMMVSNSPAFSGASWEPFSATKPWAFDSAGKVYVAFKDNAGNASPVYAANLSGNKESSLSLVLGAVHPKTGGQVSSEETKIAISFPPGAVGAKADLTLVPAVESSLQSSTGSLRSTGKFLTLTAKAGDSPVTSFSKAYTMTIGYTAGDIVGISEDSMAIYTWNGTGWVKEAGSVVNKPTKTVSASIDHLSSFALLGESAAVPSGTNRIYLPLVTRESSGW